MHPNLPPLESLPIGIQLRTRVFVILVGLAILVFILNLVRKKQLREQYALLWILSSIVLCLSAVFIGMGNLAFPDRAGATQGLQWAVAVTLWGLLLALIPGKPTSDASR